MFKIKTGIFVSFVLTFIFFVPPLEANAHTNESLEISTITQEPFIEVNSAPRSIHHVAVKAMYYGAYVYHEEYAYGSLYRGYLLYDYTALNISRYSGTLYRHDLPEYPIPSRNPMKLDLNQ